MPEIDNQPSRVLWQLKQNNRESLISWVSRLFD